jgi:hypothetical protein
VAQSDETLPVVSWRAREVVLPLLYGGAGVVDLLLELRFPVVAGGLHGRLHLGHAYREGFQLLRGLLQRC